jgi:hypothetical protein
MKFKNIIVDILSEDFQNKKLLIFMLSKWFGETPSDRDKTETEILLTSFFEIKNRLVPTLPEVITFLNRYPKFNSNGLKDVRNYTLDQTRFIVSEFVDIDTGQEDNTLEIFRGRNLPPTDERIDASKSLWYSSNNLIVDEGDFRIYAIKNRKDAINFGYYNGNIRNNELYTNFIRGNAPYSNMQWCITRHVESSNLYGGYRNRRTFYFVIDESKHPSKNTNPQQSQYYISVLQYATDSQTNYRLTSILNDGSDPVMDENQLYTIYPKLRGHLDKIVKLEYTQEELGEIIDELDRVDENPNNQYEFAKMSKAIKKRYVDSGKIISRARSWETMDTGLKQSYIDLTTRQNVFERFQTNELIMKIKSKTSELNSLDRRLKILNFENGANVLFVKIFQDGYIPDQRRSILNENISLYQSRHTKKYGLFNKSQADWATLNGVVYSDEYRYTDDETFSDENGNYYLVEVYTKSGTPDNSTFYCIFPTDTDGVDGYFLSHTQWLKLVEKIDLVGGDDIEFSPEDDTDLKENGEY